MKRSTLRALAVTFAAAGLIAGGATIAAGHPTQTTSDGGATSTEHAHDAHQHGITEGHLPASSSGNIDLISKLKLKNAVPEKIADVGVHKGYAYLAAWGVVTCRYNGVHVVDVRNPAAPKEVAFIQSKEGSYPGEGIQTISISTPKFTGDILVSNNEICKDTAGFGGMNIYDVTNPEHPVPLVEGVGDSNDTPGQAKKAANPIHSVFAWDAGDKAYAVIVDNVEGTDVDIMDITDPKNAFLTAEYDLDQMFPQIVQAAPVNLVEIFLHDMIVKEIGGRQILLASYWDAGYVKVDVTDVHKPVYLGDTDFTDPDPEAAESKLDVPAEGNGHQAEFTADNKYVVGSDEDFNPYAVIARNDTDGTTLIASQGDGTRQLVEGQTLTGGTVFVGRACNGDALVPSASLMTSDIIAVVERGLCTFTEKVANVIAAGGYDGVLIFNRTGSDACNQTLGMSVDGDILTFGVAPRQQGFALFNAVPIEADCLTEPAGTTRAPMRVGDRGDTLTFKSYFDGWGYVHLFKNQNGKMTELDTYAIPQAHDPAFASGFGDLSVHEVAASQVDPARLYFSYYSGGFRVAKIDRGKITEVGHLIDEGGSNYWGVQVFQHAGKEYVAASDRDHGLYIYRYTGR